MSYLSGTTTQIQRVIDSELLPLVIDSLATVSILLFKGKILITILHFRPFPENILFLPWWLLSPLTERIIYEKKLSKTFQSDFFLNTSFIFRQKNCSLFCLLQSTPPPPPIPLLLGLVKKRDLKISGVIGGLGGQR